MSIFKKSGSVDVLDLTRLQKKGLLNVPEVKSETRAKVNSSGWVDLGVTSGGEDVSMSDVERVMGAVGDSGAVGLDTNDSASALGFLDTFASSAASSNSGGEGSNDSSFEIQGLKNKIDDLEYKLRVLEDKIARIEG